MDDVTKAALASQFGAALEMLGNAIDACPDSCWGAPTDPHAFWYLAHHTLFWTDYYLSASPQSYRPPEPLGLEELDPAGVLPPRPTTREELVSWLALVKRRLDAHVAALGDANAGAPAEPARLGLTRLELLLYNLRHVHHHVGQLQLLLRQAGAQPPRWVSRAGAGTNRS